MLIKDLAAFALTSKSQSSNHLGLFLVELIHLRNIMTQLCIGFSEQKKGGAGD